jgi:hypothetical protein
MDLRLNAMTRSTRSIIALTAALFCLTVKPAVAQDPGAGVTGEKEVALGELDTQQPGAPSAAASTPGEPGASAGQSAEQEVDLGQLEAEASTSQAANPQQPPAGADQHLPFKFKLFFDLLLRYQFVDPKQFEFTKDHAYVILELSMADWLSFRTDVSPSPQFYELVFNLGNKLELRVGKVLIPFGQNEFHHLIGGRVDKQSLFLPVIWADYGIAFKHLLYEGETIGVDYSVWAVNGFQEGSDLNGQPAPSTNAGSLSDNNMMKGMGIRPQLHIGTAFTLGASWYMDSWDKDDEQYMYFYGVDLDFGYGFIPLPVLKDVRLRGEFARGEVQLPLQNWKKGLFGYHGVDRFGYNLEISYRILPWLSARYRFGYLDPDNRVKDVNDLFIHEPGLVARFGPVQWSLLVQLHDIRVSKPYATEPTDNSCIFTRLMLRY